MPMLDTITHDLLLAVPALMLAVLLGAVAVSGGA